MDTTGRRPFLALMLAGLARLPSAAQQAAPAPPGPYVPRQADRPEPVAGDEPGFQAIFDGKTLDGWEGSPTYWSVQDGAMVGQITPETIIRSNTFIIWREGRPKDFELKVDLRITPGGNSGVNYRSVVAPDAVTPDNKFAMRGYQCDIDGGNRYTGNNYEEKGRLFLAVRGQMTRVVGTRKPIVVAAFGDPQQMASVFVPANWNTIHITARANVLSHIVNGQLMSVVVDDDPPNRPADGLIGVQVHVGGPMKVECRNWRLKNL